MKTHENNENRQLLRDKDVASILAVSRSYVWKLVRNGILPQPTRIGRKMSVWRMADIQRFAENPALLVEGR